jgi:prepilin-type N-terminal cleavage/methylation domain-containing protein
MHRKGFTMLEVMVAFTILTVFVLATVPVLTYLIRGNVRNKSLGQARTVAERFSEQLRIQNYDSPLITDDGDTLDLNNIATPDHRDSVDLDDQRFFVLWNVFDNHPNASMKTINVIVRWRSDSDVRWHQISTICLKSASAR